MNNPTPEKFRAVADTLEGVVEKYPQAKVKMSTSRWSLEHPCDTPACVAGWYAVATGMEYVCVGIVGGGSYGRPANAMSKALGFKDMHDFTFHVRDTPEIWPAHRCANPFVYAETWGSTDDDMTLQVVIDKLRENADYMDGQRI